MQLRQNDSLKPLTSQARLPLQISLCRTAGQPVEGSMLASIVFHRIPLGLGRMLFFLACELLPNGHERRTRNRLGDIIPRLHDDARVNSQRARGSRGRERIPCSAGKSQSLIQGCCPCPVLTHLRADDARVHSLNANTRANQSAKKRLQGLAIA